MASPVITAPRVVLVRMHHDKGEVTISTVTCTTEAAAVRTVLNVEHAPMRSVLWVKAQPFCDYCDQAATRYELGGQETPLCMGCAREHNDTVRAALAATGELGPRRYPVIDRADYEGA